MELPRLATVRGEKTSTQSIPTSTFDKLDIDSWTSNPSGAFTTDSPGADDVTINWSGVYVISASILFPTPANAFVFGGVALYKNGSLDDWIIGFHGPDVATRVNGAIVSELAKGDYLSIYRWQTQSPTTTMTGSAATFTFFDVTFIDSLEVVS